MPSLFDTLGTPDAPQQKTRTLASLTDNAGMTKPTSPMQSVAMGISPTPDQAKMVGTPAQQKSRDTYAEAQQYVPTTTAVDPMAQQKAAEAKWWSEKAGSLGDRVNTAVGSMTLAQTTGAQLSADAQTAFSGDKAGLDALTTHLNVVQDAGSTREQRSAAMAEIDKLIKGKAGLTYDNLTAFVDPKDKDAFASHVASLTPDKISVANVNLGTDAEKATLASNLGLADVAALDKMTVQELQTAIIGKLQSGFSEGDKLVASLQDSTLSASDRAAARSKLAELGVTGIESSELEVRDAQQKIAEADKITINGTVYTLEELLSDANVNSQIMNAIKADGTLDETVLKNLPPALVESIKANAAALATQREASLKASGEWDTLKTGYANITKLFEVGGVDTVSAEVKSWLGIGNQPMTPEQLTALQNNPLVQTLNKFVGNDAGRAAAIQSFNDIAKLPEATRAAVRAMSYEDLAAMGLFKSGVERTNAMVYMNIYSDLIEGKTPDDSELKSMLGIDVSSDIDKFLKEQTYNYQLNSYFSGGQENITNMMQLDANKDGILTRDDIASAMKNPDTLKTLHGSMLNSMLAPTVKVGGALSSSLMSIIDAGKPITTETLSSAVANNPDAITQLGNMPNTLQDGTSPMVLARKLGDKYINKTFMDKNRATLRQLQALKVPTFDTIGRDAILTPKTLQEHKDRYEKYKKDYAEYKKKADTLYARLSAASDNAMNFSEIPTTIPIKKILDGILAKNVPETRASFSDGHYDVRNPDSAFSGVSAYMGNKGWF